MGVCVAQICRDGNVGDRHAALAERAARSNAPLAQDEVRCGIWPGPVAQVPLNGVAADECSCDDRRAEPDRVAVADRHGRGDVDGAVCAGRSAVDHGSERVVGDRRAGDGRGLTLHHLPGTRLGDRRRRGRSRRRRCRNCRRRDCGRGNRDRRRGRDRGRGGRRGCGRRLLAIDARARGDDRSDVDDVVEVGCLLQQPKIDEFGFGDVGARWMVDDPALDGERNGFEVCGARGPLGAAASTIDGDHGDGGEDADDDDGDDDLENREARIGGMTVASCVSAGHVGDLGQRTTSPAHLSIVTALSDLSSRRGARVTAPWSSPRATEPAPCYGLRAWPGRAVRRPLQSRQRRPGRIREVPRRPRP